MADDVKTVPFKIAGADGKEIEIQVPRDAVLAAVRDTHVAKDGIEADLNRRVQAIVKNQGLRKPDELLDDEAFIARIVEKHGFKRSTTPDDGGGSGGDQQAARTLKDAIARALADQETKVIKPLQDQLAKDREREDALLERDLQRAILQAAAGRAKPGMLKAVGKGKPAPIVAMLMDAFAYDEDTGTFYAAEGETFVPSKRPEDTFMSVEEFVTDWLADPARADFAEGGQAGPGAGAGAEGGRGAAGIVTLTAEQASDMRTYQAALAKVGGDHSKIRVKKPGAV